MKIDPAEGWEYLTDGVYMREEGDSIHLATPRRDDEGEEIVHEIFLDLDALVHLSTLCVRKRIT